MDKVETESDSKALGFINSEIPAVVRAQFPKICGRAYDAVEQLARDHAFLRTPRARWERGDLRSLAVESAFEQLIESGAWRVKSHTWESYARPTGVYLCIFTENAVVTISQLIDAREQPREAVFRENARFNNQTFLALPGLPPEPSSDRPHLIIGHGYQKLNFIHIGMPHPEKPKAWLERTRNLLDEVHDASSDAVPPEAAAEAVVTLKERVKRRMVTNE